MKLKLITNGFSKPAELFQNTVANRIPIEITDNGMTVELQIDSAIFTQESFLIRGDGTHWSIIGSDELGLYYGIGKFLHTAKWSETDFSPKATNGTVAPECSFRAMYFARHFYNYYHTAPISEIERYLDDMLLWGYNTVICGIPGMMMKMNDPNFQENLEAVAKDTNRIFAAAKARGMRIGYISCVNQGFIDAPEDLSSEIPDDLTYRGDLGRNICISKPEGLAYMRRVCQSKYALFDSLDYLIMWPYDEGGCGCKSCRPWGARGFLNACIEMRRIARELHPNVKIIISTWGYDVPDDEGEFEGLYRRLKGDMSWADAIMVDSHREYPRYPLEHESVKPVVNFPEISMWGLKPWGGFGANPLPERFQRIWNDSKKILNGGFPYSEGIYEDISKIQFAGYYWKKNRHWTDILAEYVNYEYSSEPTVIASTLELMRLIEINHTQCSRYNCLQPILEVAEKAMLLAQKINAALPEQKQTAWRWRILYIRAVLDYKRYKAYLSLPDHEKTPISDIAYGSDLIADDTDAQNMLQELFDDYHCVPFNGENIWTLPAIGGSISPKKITIPDRRDQAKKSGKNAIRGNEG